MSAAYQSSKPGSAAGRGAPPAGGVAVNSLRAIPMARSGMTDPEAARALVFSIIHRIEGYLDDETVALDKSLKFDFKTSNDRKSQGLLDLNQALRRLQPNDINGDLQLRLAVFREKLGINLRKIRLHLDAVKEISAMLSDAIQNAESDGTYTRNINPYRNSP